MILLNINNNIDTIITTPLDRLQAVPLFYYFKFVSRQTKAIIQITAVDISNTPRYQKFVIDTSSLFANQKEGLWTYYIKPSSINDNLEPDTEVCESGLMYLSSDSIFTPTKYEEQNNSVKAYTK